MNPFLEFPPLYFGEYALRIPDYALPGILPIYYITNYGRLFRVGRVSGLIEHCAYSNNDGYWQYGFRTINGMMTRKIHRMLMLTFKYIPGCEKLEVNHINGDGHQNWIFKPKFNEYGYLTYEDNLEWCTHKENVNHAQITGLNKQPYLSDLAIVDIHLRGNNGENPNKLAKEYGINVNTAKAIIFTVNTRYSDILKKYGAQVHEYVRRQPIPKEELVEILEEGKSGMAPEDVAKKHNITINTAKSIMHQRTPYDRVFLDMGIPITERLVRKQVPDEDLCSMKLELNNGATIGDMMKKYNCSRSLVEFVKYPRGRFEVVLRKYGIIK